MEKLTAEQIEEIAFAFGNGVDQVPWAESESHGEPDDPAPSYHVYVSDGQLMLIVPGSEDNPDFASDLADSSTKVCRAIRQLQAERGALLKACENQLEFVALLIEHADNPSAAMPLLADTLIATVSDAKSAIAKVRLPPK